MAVNLRSISGTSALPHKVGGRTRRSFDVTNRDENFNTYVVGQNNVTGRSIVSDGNGTYQLNQDLGNVRPGDQATLSRSETSEGGRYITATVRQFAGGKLLTYTYKVAAQNPIESDTINDNCDDNNGVGSPGFPPASPPEAPEPEDPPEDFIPPEEEEEEEEDPISVPFGCAPDDSAQWFNGSSCPPDTVSLGFAELPDGSVMSLCQGANTPPGDGCPIEPSTYGYSCVDGSCVEKANGSFATLAECQESGCQDPPSNEIPLNPTMGWENVDGTCQQIPGGSYNSESECISDNAEVTLVDVQLIITRELCRGEIDTFSYNFSEWLAGPLTTNITAIQGSYRGDCKFDGPNKGKPQYRLIFKNLDTGYENEANFTWISFSIVGIRQLFSDGSTIP